MTSRYKPTLIDENFYWEGVDRLITALDYDGSTLRFAVFWDRVVEPNNWTTREWDYVVDYAIMSNDTMPLPLTLKSYHIKEAIYHRPIYRRCWPPRADEDDESDHMWTEVLYVDSRVVPKEDLKEFKQYGKIEYGVW